MLEIADMPSPVSLRHPYFNQDPGQPLLASQIRDALNHASASLWLLADLFVAPVVQCETLNSDSSRLGMFSQLTTLANTLDVLSDRMGTESRKASGEISFFLSPGELRKIETLAARSGSTVESLVREILAGQLDEVAGSVKTPGSRND